jgi:hypothetical protein
MSSLFPMRSKCNAQFRNELYFMGARDEVKPPRPYDDPCDEKTDEGRDIEPSEDEDHRRGYADYDHYRF